MLNTTRMAALAAAFLVVAALVVGPRAAQAQTAAPAAPSAVPAPPAATPAPVAAPAAAAPNLRSGDVLIDNPYGLEALWRGGDAIAKATLIILVIMSMGSWYIIITKVYEQYKMGKQARAAEKSFWTAPTVQQGAAQLKASSPYRFIAESGLAATNKHTGLLGN